LAFALDPEVAAAIEPLAALAVGMPIPPVGDIATRRTVMEAGQGHLDVPASLVSTP
jgi:hypothetical protein